MIIKYKLVNLSIILFLVLLLPLIQEQWLNLYLFDINSFSFYKLLYYLSGLVIPTLVIKNSLNKFTFYKFKNKEFNNNKSIITGKILLLITSSILIILSVLISNYIFFSLRIFYNLVFSDNKFLIEMTFNNQIFLALTTSMLLIFKRIKFYIKKVSLISFLTLSLIIWYSSINNIILNDGILFDILKFDNLNYINLIFIFSIEIFYYLWSYISYGSYLSDWNLPIPNNHEIYSIVNILIFYFLIAVYYSILS